MIKKEKNKKFIFIIIFMILSLGILINFKKNNFFKIHSKELNQTKNNEKLLDFNLRNSQDNFEISDNKQDLIEHQKWISAEEAGQIN